MTAPRWHSALSHRRQSRRVNRDRAGYRGMAPSIRFAAEADIPAILKLRLAVDSDQTQRGVPLVYFEFVLQSGLSERDACG